MATKTVPLTKSGIDRLPEDKPVVYRVQTEGGKTNYVGVAKRGRVQDRLEEHLDAGKIPGAKVQIQQMSSIDEAKKTEARIIFRSGPKYNEKGK
jgi:excinuclease UvrABC nuclease subunit